MERGREVKGRNVENAGRSIANVFGTKRRREGRKVRQAVFYSHGGHVFLGDMAKCKAVLRIQIRMTAGD